MSETAVRRDPDLVTKYETIPESTGTLLPPRGVGGRG